MFFKKFLFLFIVFRITQTIKHSIIDLSNNTERIDPLIKEMQNYQENYNQIPLYKTDPNHLKFLPTNYQMINRCDLRSNATESDFYYFLPVLKGKLHTVGEIIEFENICFKTNKFKIDKITISETILSIFSSDSKSFFCQDSYIISLSNFHKIQTNYFNGEHKIILKNLNESDLLDIQINGVRLFTFCQGFLSSAHSFLMTLQLYLGGLGKDPNARFPIVSPKVPDYMEKANIRFLSKFTNNILKKREDIYGKAILNFDVSEIKTGDFLAIYRLDGLDSLIMLGTGSHIGHSAVACWIDNELYILESQDGWYWPKRGIQRNKWST